MLNSMVMATGFVLLLAQGANAAYCGKARDDMKSITVNGTIKLIETADQSWGAGRNWVEIAECPTLGVVIKGKGSCAVGRQLRATGEFFYCDEDSFDFDECGVDQLEAASFSCN